MFSVGEKSGARARPLDQGNEPTCTAHAVANAVCDYLMGRGIDVDQKAFIGGLMQLLTDTKPKNPLELTGLFVERMQDESTGNYGNVSISVELVSAKDSLNKRDSYCIVYPLDEEGHTAGPSRITHCVFIKNWYTGGDGWVFDCINSWGKKKPNPQVKANMKGNKIYRIIPVWSPIDQTDMTNDDSLCTVMSPWQPNQNDKELEDPVDIQSLCGPTYGRKFEGTQYVSPGKVAKRVTTAYFENPSNSGIGSKELLSARYEYKGPEELRQAIEHNRQTIPSHPLIMSNIHDPTDCWNIDVSQTPVLITPALPPGMRNPHMAHLEIKIKDDEGYGKFPKIPNTCDVCSSKFYNKYDLYSHYEMTQHNKE